MLPVGANIHQRIPVTEEEDDEVVLDATLLETPKPPNKQPCCTIKGALCSAFMAFFFLVVGIAGKHEYSVMFEQLTLTQIGAINQLFYNNDITAEVCGNYGKYACGAIDETRQSTAYNSVAEIVQDSADARAVSAYTEEIKTQRPKTMAATFFLQCTAMISSRKQTGVTTVPECSTLYDSYGSALLAGVSVMKISARFVVTGTQDGMMAFVYDNAPLNTPATLITWESDPCGLSELYRHMMCEDDNDGFFEDCSSPTFYVVGAVNDVCTQYLRIVNTNDVDINSLIQQGCTEQMLAYRSNADCLRKTTEFWNEPSDIYTQSEAHMHNSAVDILAIAKRTISQVAERVSVLGPDAKKLFGDILITDVVPFNNDDEIPTYLFGNSFADTVGSVQTFATLSGRFTNTVPMWSAFPVYNAATNVIRVPAYGMAEWLTHLSPADYGRISFMVSRSILTVLQQLSHTSNAVAQINEFAECAGLKMRSVPDTIDAVATRLAFEISQNAAKKAPSAVAISINGVGRVTWSMQATMAAASMTCSKGNTVRSNIPDWLDVSQPTLSVTTLGMHTAYGCPKHIRTCSL